MGNIIGESHPRVKIEERVYQYTRTRRPPTMVSNPSFQHCSSCQCMRNCNAQNINNHLSYYAWLKPNYPVSGPVESSSSQREIPHCLTNDTTIYPLVYGATPLPLPTTIPSQSSQQLPQLVWHSSSQLNNERVTPLASSTSSTWRHVNNSCLPRKSSSFN